jgi:hypothetical protein
MSGGAWEYFYLKLHDVANALLYNHNLDSDSSLELTDQQIAARNQLGNYLRNLADVMHTVEWVDSGDMSPPADVDAIDKFFRSAGVPLEIVKKMATGLQWVRSDHGFNVEQFLGDFEKWERRGG